jgi:transposase-like protein
MGAPIKDVAEQLGVKAATAYFWVKRALQKQRPQFAVVVPATQARRVRGARAAAGLRVCEE